MSFWGLISPPIQDVVTVVAFVILWVLGFAAGLKR